jgi:hypothetical protein
MNNEFIFQSNLTALEASKKRKLASVNEQERKKIRKEDSMLSR